MPPIRDILSMLAPELVLTALACLLFLLGCSRVLAIRRALPAIALAGLAAVLLIIWYRGVPTGTLSQSQVFIDRIGFYVRLITPAVAIMLLLLAWPTDRQATGNSALHFGPDGGEFFALFLLSVTGLLLTCASNDLILLFLALELTSIPTYIMVSISRPVPVAQEAGVKYFFLGALSVALMIFGFSYLYGTTGQINLPEITRVIRAQATGVGWELTTWQKIGVILVLVGFAFKMAAFPLHFYAGDVYEGAATPVTAFLAFVPKAAGFVATLKLLQVVGGPDWDLPRGLVPVLWVIAALTMTLGNVLGLLQNNVKRVLAYSSIAHSGYMLVALTALPAAKEDALRGVLFYLAAYGIMNAAAFGVLILLPSRTTPMLAERELASEGVATPGEVAHETAAETFEDLAGAGRRHVGLGLAMAIACFSLIGIPLTVGFLGKLMLIRPALVRSGIYQPWLTWLVVILVINAAISAAYYLKIVATMFLRTETGIGEVEIATAQPPAGRRFRPSLPVLVAVLLSAAATLIFGAIPQAAQRLADLLPAQNLPETANSTAQQPSSQQAVVSADTSR